jgi:thioester reductase-like protein/acyl carrier protein
LLVGDLTLEDLLHEEIVIESENTDTFNYEKLLAYVHTTYKNRGLCIIRFTTNSFIEDQLTAKTIQCIRGDFQLGNRYKVYKKIVEAGNEALRVENAPHVFKDLELPIFELERYWPEKPQQTIVPQENDQEVKTKKAVHADDIKLTLRKIWKEILEIEDFTEQDDFFSLEGTSLTGLDVITRLERKYDIIINYQDIFDFPTFESQAKLIQDLLAKETATTTEKVEIKKAHKKVTKYGYRKLLRSFETIEKQEKLNPQNILITGGTGFLGAFLINRLLEVTKAHMYVLTRVTATEDASTRFWKRFSSYFEISSSERITVIEGDILTENLSSELANVQIDTVYHAAGIVSHFGKIQQSLDINFTGTKRVMDWSLANKVTHFNHFSTVAVSGLTADKRLEFYETDLDYNQTFSNHIYSKSKFLSEKYVFEQKEKISVYVFRLGNIGGRFHDGLFQHNILQNNVYTELIALTEIGMYSQSIANLSMDLIPVDKTINSLVDLSLIENKKLNTFHFVLKETYKIPDIVKALEKNDIQIRLVDDATLQSRVEKLNGEGVNNEELNSVKKLFYTNRNQRGLEDFVTPEISTEATDQYLQKQEIKYPYNKEEYLYNTIHHLITNKLIQK